MIMSVITFFLQVLTYIVVELDEFEVASGVSVYSIILWAIIITIVLLIVSRLVNKNE